MKRGFSRQRRDDHFQSPPGRFPTQAAGRRDLQEPEISAEEKAEVSDQLPFLSAPFYKLRSFSSVFG